MSTSTTLRPPDQTQSGFDPKPREQPPVKCVSPPRPPDVTQPNLDPAPKAPAPAHAVSIDTAAAQAKTNATIKVHTPSTVTPNAKI